MAVETVSKTIGTTGTFSTPQLWDDGAPANLTTAERSACGTFLVANFIQGESLTFTGSGATGVMLDTDNATYMTYGITAGNPAASDTITGATSLGTCVLTSGTPNFTGVIWQGQCQNQEFSGTGVQVTIVGSTDSSLAYKELTTIAGASFRDNANVQTNALRYNASNGCGITGTSNNTATIAAQEPNNRVSKLQVAATGAGGRAISASSSSGSFYDFLILEGKYTGATATLGVLGLVNTTIIRNTVIVQRASAADHIVGTGATSSKFYNCTIVASDDLATAPVSIFLSGASGTVTVQNCGLFAGADVGTAAGSATFTFTTCYGDDSTPATGITTATYSSEFQNVNDATRDFRLVTGAAQKDTGTTDSVNAANDIAGTARPSGSAYDVGCWEFVAAAGGAPGSGRIRELAPLGWNL